jgi:hypothetical protein
MRPRPAHWRCSGSTYQGLRSPALACMTASATRTSNGFQRVPREHFEEWIKKLRESIVNGSRGFNPCFVRHSALSSPVRITIGRSFSRSVTGISGVWPRPHGASSLLCSNDEDGIRRTNRDVPVWFTNVLRAIVPCSGILARLSRHEPISLSDALTVFPNRVVVPMEQARGNHNTRNQDFPTLARSRLRIR